MSFPIAASSVCYLHNKDKTMRADLNFSSYIHWCLLQCWHYDDHSAPKLKRTPAAQNEVKHNSADSHGSTILAQMHDGLIIALLVLILAISSWVWGNFFFSFFFCLNWKQASLPWCTVAFMHKSISTPKQTVKPSTDQKISLSFSFFPHLWNKDSMS